MPYRVIPADMPAPPIKVPEPLNDKVIFERALELGKYRREKAAARAAREKETQAQKEARTASLVYRRVFAKCVRAAKKGETEVRVTFRPAFNPFFVCTLEVFDRVKGLLREAGISCVGFCETKVRLRWHGHD